MNECTPPTLPKRLPRPDQYGNYWLSFGQRPNGPALLKAGGYKASNRSEGWFASHGDDRGVLFSGTQIRYFLTPESALEALREGN